MLTRRLALIVTVCLICAVCGCALASEVAITIRSDRKAYRSGEIAYLSIDIQNNTNQTITNLYIQNFIPDGLIYVNPGDAQATVAELAPGQKAHHVVRLRAVNIPKTGDRAKLIAWSLLLVAALGVLVWQFGRARRKDA